MTEEIVGQCIGNYRLVRLLGSGSFANVYLGEHLHLGTYSAIKILHTKLTEDGIKSFLGEARILAHLNHPHIIKVLDFDVHKMSPFLVMRGTTPLYRLVNGKPDHFYTISSTERDNAVKSYGYK